MHDEHQRRSRPGLPRHNTGTGTVVPAVGPHLSLWPPGPADSVRSYVRSLCLFGHEEASRPAALACLRCCCDCNRGDGSIHLGRDGPHEQPFVQLNGGEPDTTTYLKYGGGQGAGRQVDLDACHEIAYTLGWSHHWRHSYMLRRQARVLGHDEENEARISCCDLCIRMTMEQATVVCAEPELLHT